MSIMCNVYANNTVVDPSRKVPDLYFKVVNLKLQVADLRSEVAHDTLGCGHSDFSICNHSSFSFYVAFLKLLLFLYSFCFHNVFSISFSI